VNAPLKTLRYDTRSAGISVLPAHPRISANGMNHTCLCLPKRSWNSFIPTSGPGTSATAC